MTYAAHPGESPKINLLIRWRAASRSREKRIFNFFSVGGGGDASAGRRLKFIEFFSSAIFGVGRHRHRHRQQQVNANEPLTSSGSANFLFSEEEEEEEKGRRKKNWKTRRSGVHRPWKTRY